tara:strand:+ start:9183 stop:9701 length:519 start_codon:yes stop_codon:yes gene_type:complete
MSRQLEIEIYNYNDLKKNDELCDTVYEKFWIENPDNINWCAEDNIDGFKEFAEVLKMSFDYSLSNSQYQDRSCYIKLEPYSQMDNTEYRNIVTNYNPHYWIGENLKTFTLKFLNQEKYQYLTEWSLNDFVLEIQEKMFDLWFADNRDYYSKEYFLDHIECNQYEFNENGELI